MIFEYLYQFLNHEVVDIRVETKNIHDFVHTVDTVCDEAWKTMLVYLLIGQIAEY